MTRLILVRHGQSEANLAVWFAGHTDAKLTPLGQQQAEAVARYLLPREQINKVYASDLSRATETARPTAKAFSLPIHPEPGLREIFAGEWEAKPFSELKQRYTADWEQWSTDLPHSLCTGGETVAQLYARVLETVTRIATENDGKTVLLASHWTPILCIIGAATGCGLARLNDCPTPKNASLQILRFENGQFSAEALNITAHLDGITGGSHP